MKRSVTSNSVSQAEASEAETSSLLDYDNNNNNKNTNNNHANNHDSKSESNVESLTKSVNSLSLKSAKIDFHVEDCSTLCSNNNSRNNSISTRYDTACEDEQSSCTLDDKKNLLNNYGHMTSTVGKSKSLSVLDDNNNSNNNNHHLNTTCTGSSVSVRLVSPYGDWCAFSGGAGSGGCIFTGPYEPMIIPKDEFSDESFESTEESDAYNDFNEPQGITHGNLKNTDIVWAKRPGLPWFPGIIIDPHSLNQKEVKHVMKDVGVSNPHKDQLSDFSAAIINTKQTDRLFFVHLFNRKKTWIWLAESKVRPFCKENDHIFMENCHRLSHKYKKELEKAYKKAKRHCKDPELNDSTNNHHHHHHHFSFHHKDNQKKN